MTTVTIPHPERKRALILVDIQKGFLKENTSILIPIQRVITEGNYSLIIEAVFHAEPGSLWEKQTGWTFPLQPTMPEIKNLLKSDVIKLTKTTRSAFKGDIDLANALRTEQVEEVHIVGLDSNDCIFATAQEAFDLGFFTYVLEECTVSSSGDELHKSAIKILRHLDMTNHSKLIKTRETLI